MVDMSVGVKKVTQMKFDVASTEGKTPGNLFLNQDWNTHRSMKGAVVETKVVDSTNSSMYFINVIREGVSQGVVKASLVHSMEMHSVCSIKAWDSVI